MFSPDTRILVVDDMKTMRVLLRKRLSELGLNNVTEAVDGDPAWKEIEKQLAAGSPFQLIISDWLMPETNGIHLLQRVRSNSKLKATPFIMLTAENEAGAVKEAIAAGVTGYLVKPFTPETFKEKLEAAFAASKRSDKKVA